jgi:polar amino acid transport system permease protein
MDWSLFWHLLVNPPSSFVTGAIRTVYLAVISQMLGVALGLLLALWRRGPYVVLRIFASGYIWIIRGTPLLVQAVLFYDGISALGLYSFPNIEVLGISIPGVIQAGIITLSLNEGAYMAEIIRAAIDSVDSGQSEAAESLGMRKRQAMRHVVLPQAMRVVIPPLGNEFNNMLKVTSLLSVIGLQELFLAAQDYNSATLQTFTIFIAVAIYYIVMTTVWAVIQSWIERRLEAQGGVVIERVSLRSSTVTRLGAAAKMDEVSQEGLKQNAVVERVRAVSVHKWFGRLHVLDDVSLTVRQGEVVVVIGPSGSGKTTLLRCLNHLERIDDGRLWINGHLIGYRETSNGRLVDESEAEIARQRAEIGFVFQHFNLFPHLRAIDNVSLAPVRVRKLDKDQARAEARQLLSRVGLEDKCEVYPRQLSGGQRQRVAIARALAMKPSLMLFDEPTSALDPEMVGEVLEVMRELARDGMTMVIASHEMGFARSVADRIVMMAEARVVESGPPDQVLDHPLEDRTRAFLSKVLS